MANLKKSKVDKTWLVTRQEEVKNGRVEVKDRNRKLRYTVICPTYRDREEYKVATSDMSLAAVEDKCDIKYSAAVDLYGFSKRDWILGIKKRDSGKQFRARPYALTKWNSSKNNPSDLIGGIYEFAQNSTTISETKQDTNSKVVLSGIFKNADVIPNIDNGILNMHHRIHKETKKKKYAFFGTIWEVEGDPDEFLAEIQEDGSNNIPTKLIAFKYNNKNFICEYFEKELFIDYDPDTTGPTDINHNYSTVGGNLSEDTTWTAGTYYITSAVVLNAYNLTFDASGGNVVIKTSGAVSIYHSSTGSITSTNTSLTNRVIFTSKNDDAHGEAIAGSSGSPAAGDQSTNYIYSYSGATSTVSLDHFEVWYYSCSTSYRFAIGFTNDSDITINLTNGLFKYNTVAAATRAGLIGQGNTYTYQNSVTLDNIRIDATNDVSVTTGYIIIFYINDMSSSFKNININIPSMTAENSRHALYLATRGNGTRHVTIENCLICYDNSTTYGLIQIECMDSTCVFNVDIKNCLINSSGTGDGVWFRTFNGGLGLGSGNSTITNCVLMNCDDALKRSSPISVTHTYNTYYNNDDDCWEALSTGEKTGTDPVLGDLSFVAPAGLVSGFALEDGFAVTYTGVLKTGSDTYDNLGIDETKYTPNGSIYEGTDYVTPGIYYEYSSPQPANVLHSGILIHCEPLFPLAGVSANAVHASSIVECIPLDHAVDIGAAFAHAVSIIELEPLPQVAAAGGSSVHSASIIELLPLSPAVAGGGSVVHSTSIIELLSLSHEAAVGATQSQSAPTIDLVPNTHEVSFPVNVLHAASIIIVEPLTHIVAAGGGYSINVNTIEFITLSHTAEKIYTAMYYLGEGTTGDQSGKHKDTTIIDYNGSWRDYCYASSVFLYTYKTATLEYRSLLQFNLSGVSAHVKSAVLSLMMPYAPAASGTIYANRLLTPWGITDTDEGETAYPATTGQATVLNARQYPSGNASLSGWALGINSGISDADWIATPSDALHIYDPADYPAYSRIEFDLTSDIAAMVSGAVPNNGFILREESSTLVYMASQEWTDPQYRPLLTIGGFPNEIVVQHSGVFIDLEPLAPLVGISAHVPQTSSIVEYLLLNHTTTTGASYGHSSMIVEGLLLNPDVSTGASYGRAPLNVKLEPLSPKVAIGASVAHKVNIIKIVYLSSIIAGGSSSSHSISIIKFSPLPPTVGIGSIATQTTTVVEVLPLSHSVSGGGSVFQTTTVVEVLPLTTQVAGGASFQLQSDLIKVELGSHVVSTGASFTHVVNEVQLLDRAHSAATGAIHYQSVALTDLVRLSHIAAAGGGLGHSISTIDSISLSHNIASGGGYIHNNINISFVPLTHLVDVDDIAHSIKTIESRKLIHSVQTGASHSTDVKIIDILPSSTIVKMGCSYVHSITYIDIVPLGGQSHGGCSYTHSALRAALITLSHSAATGTIYQHQSSISKLVSVPSIINTGSSFTSSLQTLEVITQTHQARKVIRYNATSSQVIIVSGNHIITTPIHHYPEAPEPEYVDPPRIHGDYNAPDGGPCIYTDPIRTCGEYNKSTSSTGGYTETRTREGYYNKPKINTGEYKKSKKKSGSYNKPTRSHNKYINPDKTRGSYVSS